MKEKTERKRKKEENGANKRKSTRSHDSLFIDKDGEDLNENEEEEDEDEVDSKTPRVLSLLLLKSIDFFGRFVAA